MNYITLNNGVEMPAVGYGVYQVSPDECVRCVEDALHAGYRLIDTAQSYDNEYEVGQGLRQSGVVRGDIFLTTKIWIANAGYEKAKASIDDSLRRLQTDYIDLMLIHQPFGDYYGTYRAMEEAYKAGKLRAIGVSNFFADRFIDLCHNVEVMPAVNQVETHVFHQQAELHAIMDKYGVVHESWGPFAEGRKDFFTHPVLQRIGTAHHKTAAQAALRFLLQKDIVVIPKSVHKDRMVQNLDIFDFSLSDSEMKELEGLDEKESLFFSHYDPKMVEWFYDMVKARKLRK
ncbi:2,5-diketo-D-gluconic acid reductase [Megasphaera sp. ASD88]|jgi:2,5-diketo-D-gluconate reductase A|uniref:aldo/keto reductase n=1 Tax=Megasphaera TaxID=906 RepID=UPI000BAB85F3|nr:MULTISPECIES: aldo/keto reductase [Megasphaera]PAV38611.1 2,5-diketo-D-gluconic acid reductase [Megasphaera sp. ASD88]